MSNALIQREVVNKFMKTVLALKPDHWFAVGRDDDSGHIDILETGEGGSSEIVNRLLLHNVAFHIFTQITADPHTRTHISWLGSDASAQSVNDHVLIDQVLDETELRRVEMKDFQATPHAGWAFLIQYVGINGERRGRPVYPADDDSGTDSLPPSVAPSPGPAPAYRAVVDGSHPTVPVTLPVSFGAPSYQSVMDGSHPTLPATLPAFFGAAPPVSPLPAARPKLKTPAEMEQSRLRRIQIEHNREIIRQLEQENLQQRQMAARQLRIQEIQRFLAAQEQQRRVEAFEADRVRLAQQEEQLRIARELEEEEELQRELADIEKREEHMRKVLEVRQTTNRMARMHETGELDFCGKVDWSDPESFGEVVSYKRLKISSVNMGESFEETEQEPVELRVMRNPFSRGVSRSAHFALNANNERFVAKQITLTPIPSKRRELAVRDCRAQMLAKEFTDQFREVLKEKAPECTQSVEMIETELIWRETETEGTLYFALEALLDGEYVKYNNNDSKVFKRAIVPNALSHFSFVHSQQKQLIVDLQGVYCKETEAYRLTDPAVHTAAKTAQLGDTNLHQRGFAGFFAGHECGDLCQKLGLDTVRFEVPKPEGKEKASTTEGPAKSGTESKEDGAYDEDDDSDAHEEMASTTEGPSKSSTESEEDDACDEDEDSDDYEEESLSTDATASTDVKETESRTRVSPFDPLMSVALREAVEEMKKKDEEEAKKKAEEVAKEKEEKDVLKKKAEELMKRAEELKKKLDEPRVLLCELLKTAPERALGTSEAVGEDEPLIPEVAEKKTTPKKVPPKTLPKKHRLSVPSSDSVAAEASSDSSDREPTARPRSDSTGEGSPSKSPGLRSALKRRLMRRFSGSPEKEEIKEALAERKPPALGGLIRDRMAILEAGLSSSAATSTAARTGVCVLPPRTEAKRSSKVII